MSHRGQVNASHNSYSGFIWSKDGFVKSPTHEITHIVDRIGGGDALMAGIIYGLNIYKDDQKTINFALAAAALKHTIPGDFNLVTVEEVERLMEGDGSGRVLR